MRNRNVDIIYEYYHWLCTLVDVEQTGQSYWKLVKLLFKKPFYWSVPNDDNRAFDGKQIREQFCQDMHLDYNYEDFSVETSMLELLIGLAYRCESIMEGDMEDWKMIDWFWKLIENCGLDKFTDDAFDELLAEHILNKIIERTYHRNGLGGLFPLKHSKKDQRKVELWYQMSEYLLENYYT